MASDYTKIKAENVAEYGKGIGRIGPMLLANRYDDRTHFIYELLQNAEDALRRRENKVGHRSVRFTLSRDSLRVSHFGQPFTDRDVRGICGIGEGTKSADLTAIGHFGIGFKAVYAFTEAPAVHSGDEHFAIDSFVWPRQIPAETTETGETVFVLPFRKDDATAFDEISLGLQQLGARTLLFLREIEEIEWSVEGAGSGLYLREKPIRVGNFGRKILLVGQQDGKDPIDETWLIFSREVKTDAGNIAGHVEVAWLHNGSADSPRVLQVPDSTLVVFFPTILSTNLGLLLQGPYRTTPSRDNVPRNDVWNQRLVQETTGLLVASLGELRTLGLVDAALLRTLPIDRSKFPESSMFAPVFEGVRKALSESALLPQFGGGHVAAKCSKLARSQDLRNLFSSAQLATIYGVKGELAWITEDITEARAAELRRYLIDELHVAEVRPEDFFPLLKKTFLESQSDAWITQLYEYLSEQPTLQTVCARNDVPIIRLEDGSHVLAQADEVYLPSSIATDFPTVRKSLCASERARKFLREMGLNEPDPVDDVIRNVLPRYATATPTVSASEYASDVARVVRAFATDSQQRRMALITAVFECYFIAAVDADNGKRTFAIPLGVYLATERMTALFSGVPGVLLADDSYECLRGEDVRSLLESCGATRYLLPLPSVTEFGWEEKREMRRKGGCESCTYDVSLDDYMLRGLGNLLAQLPTFDSEKQKQKSRYLWEALGDLLDRRREGAFSGTYRWMYHHTRTYSFDAAFVRTLNETAWVPARDGTLQKPAYVVFDDTDWDVNPFLQSKIVFKPAIIDELAIQAGIEPAVLDLLKKLGLTSVADLRTKLGIADEPPIDKQGDGTTVADAVKGLLGESPQPTPPIPDPSIGDPTWQGGGSSSGGGTNGSGDGDGELGAGGAGTAGGGKGTHRGGTGSHGTKRPATHTGGDGPAGTGSRPFISFMGAHPDEEEPDPDGLTHEARLSLEVEAITLILSVEPELERTKTNNPGFDLFVPGPNCEPVRWLEVKAMKSDLHSRPVGMSHTQFECAQKHREDFWLYVVEYAGTAQARIVRIQDPAGKAQTFTFDHGWLNVAEITQPGEGALQEQSDKE
jgi:hypothetical protein